ncbi:YesL family protein [Gracilibacillus sp. D59]|uniref:YesL family protein n=1 Tax=Gracilibacillus sp. D59 TaxID=3457434 RepID=UPI003FCD9EE7
MEFSGLIGVFYRISHWIYKLAYVNLLWILFTLIGGVLLGFMPATVALFTIMRKWIMGEDAVAVFNMFWNTFRQDFIKSNLLGIVLFGIGYVLYIDLAILPDDGVWWSLLRYGIIVCSILFLIVIFYIFPVYVHYKLKNPSYIKYALLLGIAYPHITIAMLIGVVMLYVILYNIPGLIPFFTASLLAHLLMLLSVQVFRKVDKKQANTLN